MESELEAQEEGVYVCIELIHAVVFIHEIKFPFVSLKSISFTLQRMFLGLDSQVQVTIFASPF